MCTLNAIHLPPCTYHHVTLYVRIPYTVDMSGAHGIGRSQLEAITLWYPPLLCPPSGCPNPSARKVCSSNLNQVKASHTQPTWLGPKSQYSPVCAMCLWQRQILLTYVKMHKFKWAMYELLKRKQGQGQEQLVKRSLSCTTVGM